MHNQICNYAFYNVMFVCNADAQTTTNFVYNAYYQTITIDFSEIWYNTL